MRIVRYFLLFIFIPFITENTLSASSHKEFVIAEPEFPNNVTSVLSGFTFIPSCDDGWQFSKDWRLVCCTSSGRYVLFVAGDNWFDCPNLFMPEIISGKSFIEGDERVSVCLSLEELRKCLDENRTVKIRTTFGPLYIEKRCLNFSDKPSRRKFVYAYQYEPFFSDDIYISSSSEKKGNEFISSVLELLK